MIREEIDREIARHREHHPELRRPLRWPGLRTVLKRVGISVVSAPIKGPALLISQFGTSVIVLNADLPPRDHTRWAAHELAHAWLHAPDSHEPCFDAVPCGPDDPREREANYFAMSLLLGPGIEAEWPEPPRPETPTRRGRVLPERTPAVRTRVTLLPAKRRPPHRGAVPVRADPYLAADHLGWLLAARARQASHRRGLKKFGT